MKMKILSFITIFTINFYFVNRIYIIVAAPVLYTLQNQFIVEFLIKYYRYSLIFCDRQTYLRS